GDVARSPDPVGGDEEGGGHAPAAELLETGGVLARIAVIEADRDHALGAAGEGLADGAGREALPPQLVELARELDAGNGEGLRSAPGAHRFRGDVVVHEADPRDTHQESLAGDLRRRAAGGSPGTCWCDNAAAASGSAGRRSRASSPCCRTSAGRRTP